MRCLAALDCAEGSAGTLNGAERAAESLDGAERSATLLDAWRHVDWVVWSERLVFLGSVFRSLCVWKCMMCLGEEDSWFCELSRETL